MGVPHQEVGTKSSIFFLLSGRFLGHFVIVPVAFLVALLLLDSFCGREIRSKASREGNLEGNEDFRGWQDQTSLS